MKQKIETIGLELSNRRVECCSSEMTSNSQPPAVKRIVEPANDYDGARAHISDGARARNASRASAPAPLCLDVYREQVSPIELLQREEESGIKAPTTEELRIYNRTNAYYKTTTLF